MKLIVASDPQGGIGYKNKLPWDKLEGDLPRFKRLTANQVILMGKNTWLSLPKKPLPNRLNVIISKSLKEQEEAIVLPNAERFKNVEEVWVIGGSKLISSVMEHINEIHLSLTHKSFKCDTFINLDYIFKNFNTIDSIEHTDHTYQIFLRKNL